VTTSTFVETLGVDPSAAPTVATPGSDITHNFERRGHSGIDRRVHGADPEQPSLLTRG
jgi:hypothetical protein